MYFYSFTSSLYASVFDIQNVSITFYVKDSTQHLQGALIQILEKEVVLAQKVTDDDGKASFHFPNYENKPVTIRVTVAGYKDKEIRDFLLRSTSSYPIVMIRGVGVDIEMSSNPTVEPPKEVKTMSKREIKRSVKLTKKIFKKEEKYRKKLAAINKDLFQIHSSCGRLDELQKQLDKEIGSGSISEQEAEKKQNDINATFKELEIREQKIYDRIRALNIKFGKVPN